MINISSIVHLCGRDQDSNRWHANSHGIRYWYRYRNRDRFR